MNICPSPINFCSLPAAGEEPLTGMEKKNTLWFLIWRNFFFDGQIIWYLFLVTSRKRKNGVQYDVVEDLVTDRVPEIGIFGYPKNRYLRHVEPCFSSFFIKILGKFDDCSKFWSAFGTLHFEKPSNGKNWRRAPYCLLNPFLHRNSKTLLTKNFVKLISRKM